MIGGMLHKDAQNRQVLAQTVSPAATGLAGITRWGNVEGGHGRSIPAPCPNRLFRTPSPSGQISASRADLLVFSRAAKRLPRRRGMADWRLRSDFNLRKPRRAGLVPPSVKKPTKGWAGCEQQEYSLQLRYVRALRPVVTPRANRRFMARGRACLARLSLTVIRYWGQPSAPGAMCCIASKTPANADRPDSALNDRPFTGPTHIMRNAAADQLVRGGALRFRPLQTKDTSCSPRS